MQSFPSPVPGLRPCVAGRDLAPLLVKADAPSATIG
jgi:hypothetical protein